MLIVRGHRIVLPTGEAPASIHIQGETIVAVRGFDDVPAGAELVDAGDLVVSPGVVDTHVHVNEPGRAEWEGFDTATRAAAAGGVTTIVDMPLNSVPATTSVGALEQKRSAARGQCHVDVGFWGGVVPGNAAALEPLIEAGVRGFKCFLVPSGVDEFLAVNEVELRAALPILARRGVPLLVHAESPSRIKAHEGDAGRYSDYQATRPPEAEVEAIRLMARLSRECQTAVHIVHVSDAGSIETIADAQGGGIPLTAETCPHYLTFAAEEIPDGATEYKCAPPIRGRACRRALWAGLQSGVLTMVASDHSPAPPALKPRGDFEKAWGGIASIELSLPAVWTSAREQGSGPGDLARWMSEQPAALAGLSASKGRLAAGCDADLVVWDPDAEFTVEASRLQQRHKISPYAGRRLRGEVRSTFVRGTRVWEGGELVRPRSGHLI